MASNFDFKNFGYAPPAEGSGQKPPENSPLVRQPSIYSLTFEEFQNTWGGGLRKDFGSMNMDELLKNIWSAEETQAMTNSVAAGEGSAPGGNLQRQGSLTLPRTISQKTVEEVYRDLIKESSGNGKDGNNGGVSNLPQTPRQPTLGEITLEEFLVRAGVVREDAQQIERQNNGGFFGDLSRLNNNNNNATALALGFQQPNQTNGLMGTTVMENSNNFVAAQTHSSALNVGAIRSSHQVPQQQQLHQPQLPQQQQQQQPLFPKTANVAFASPVNLMNSPRITSPGVRGTVTGIGDASANNNLVPVAGLKTGGVTVAAGSPANPISTDVLVKNNTDVSSLSPAPYAFTRGRKASAAFEKVIERRQRRMIKNRESAARSRARKQAYQLELEAEIAKLKELNQELQRKQAELMEMQKNEVCLLYMRYIHTLLFCYSLSFHFKEGRDNQLVSDKLTYKPGI
ncbi:hypothetical protein Tsubulata_007299 [Turnera subulata]|uniref:BZIP domain-containing protein n=1 Tax=Turnera subulata TaxID=218843 RepID=A0A9Q0FRP4_9ROSI|nr:hypothetical protein Tsubulata_007299 [Turnera subulata]